MAVAENHLTSASQPVYCRVRGRSIGTVDLEIVITFKYSMASAADQTPGRWTEYYNVKEWKIDVLNELDEIPSRHFETVTENLLLQPGELALKVATNPYNSILLPGTPASKKVQMMHHCFRNRDE
jgi:hypothetical protein